ncbi:MAG: hypothetical protein HY954_08785 [Deltaproteobacteria bacterium]|nr:hypothetical protein [Deltaproteobacteria bacterium]
MRELKLLLAVVIFLFALEAFKADASVNVSRIVLTNNIKEAKALSSFDCKDKVHVLIPKVKANGAHLLEAYWINPEGKRQQYSRQEFTVGKKPVDVWVWLEFNPASGGRLFSSIDPSAGMGQFVGNWRVRVYLDEKLIEEKDFMVAC